MKAMNYARKAHAPSGLKIGPRNDSFEREADRTADEVMRGTGPVAHWSFSRMSIAPPLQRKCSCGGSAGAGGECEECKAEKQLQRTATDAGPTKTPASVGNVLQSSGIPLDRETRSFFESRFRRDFSSVRIYAGGEAASSARDVAAKAYTVGNQIVFNSGLYAPHTQEGKKLLAHELTHVVQQEGATRAPHTSRLAVGEANHSSEAEADSAARVAGNGLGAGGSELKITSRQTQNTVRRLPAGWSSDYQNKWRNNPEAKSFLEKPYDEYKSGLGDVKPTTQGGITENQGREYKGGAGKGTPAGAEITMPMLKEMYPDFAKDVDADDTGTRGKQAKTYLDNLNQAFRIMKIDTVEAQANYLAHAFIESGQFRAFTESQAGSGKPNNTWS